MGTKAILMKNLIFSMLLSIVLDLSASAQVEKQTQLNGEKKQAPDSSHPNKLIWKPLADLDDESSSPLSKREKPSISLTPKFAKRISDLKEQIDLAQRKGFLSTDDAASLTLRQTQLIKQDEDAARQKYPLNLQSELEKAITQLNADLYKLMNKDKSAQKTDTVSDTTTRSKTQNTEPAVNTTSAPESN